MVQLFTNNATTTITNNPLSAGGTSITLSSGTGALFPSPTNDDYFLGTLTQSGTQTSWEIVAVTARSTDTLTVIRAFEGTTAASWPSGSVFAIFLTAGMVNGLLQQPNVASGGPLTFKGTVPLP